MNNDHANATFERLREEIEALIRRVEVAERREAEAFRLLNDVNQGSNWYAARDAWLKSRPLRDGDFRICEFCGCNTNARMRACCDAGRDADRARSRRSP